MFVPLIAALLTASPPHSAEVARVQVHLDGAEAFALGRDLSSLTPEQRARREENLARLRDYRDAGRFPRNRDFPGRRMPYFRDAGGTLCAMAQLLWESGERALVENVVARRNNATVHELVDEPGLAVWLETQGLTLEEAARIQPSYDFYDVQVVTAPTAVDGGACSGAFVVSVMRKSNGAPVTSAYGGLYAPTSPTVRFFSDPECLQDLGTQTFNEMAYASVQASDGAAVFHLRETTAGPLTLEVEFGAARPSLTIQIHEAAMPPPPDGGHHSPEPEPDPQPEPTEPKDGWIPIPQGCAAAPGLFLFGTLLLAPLFRRRR